MTSRTALAAIKAALGPGGWLEAPGDVAPYLTDFRGLYRGATPLVARPDTVEKVAAVVRLCATEGIGIVPHGGNTSYCGGATPRESGTEIVLSLGRLNRIRSVDAAGYALTVDAGCTLAAAQAAAIAAGRRFPLSLGSEGTCQIGGNLSTNAGGTAVLRYGMVRELVLGLEVVLPNGRVLDQLRSLRKDNTGYDVKQLFIGAEGTLGVITAACLKLFPLPDDYLTALVAIDGVAAAVTLLGRIRDAFGDSIEGFEYVPRIAHELALAHVPGVITPFTHPYPAFALIELATPRSLPELASRFEEFLAGEVDAQRARDAVVAKSGAQRDALWFLREHIPEAQTREGASIKHDVALPVARLADFVAAAERRVAALAPGARIVGYGHVGDGNLHFNLSPPPGVARDSAEQAAFLTLAPAVNRAIHDLVAELGGSFTAEHGIGRLKVAELERYEDPAALAVMRSIKAALDPHGIMNPGKVLRG
ncbi:MAG TPA: FAD-binding oxidoreductase [Steroidobacteraceae bacterium]|nr:FAD-binding oxidoreductase [Steroidobacteraceae bacterium]